MTCRDFFDANRGNKQYCKLLQQLTEAQQVEWEGLSASEHSPGVVANDEDLVRRVEDPTHFDASTGKIKPTFFDDASSKGASCFRLNHTSIEKVEEDARKHVEEVNKNPPPSGARTAVGYTKFSAAEVRGIFPETENKRRGAAVYDTGIPTESAHADVCQLVSGTQAGKSVRAQLFQLVKERLVAFAALDPAGSESSEITPDAAGSS